MENTQSRNTLKNTVDMLISERSRIEARLKELSALPFGVVDENEVDMLKFEKKDIQDAINALEHLIDTYCDNRIFVSNPVFNSQNG